MSNSKATILEEPSKPIHLPNAIHWLSGEGCGSWFHLENSETDYIISRFSPSGNLECKGLFTQIEGKSLNLNVLFEFTYLSHCASISIIQNKQLLKFNLIRKC